MIGSNCELDLSLRIVGACATPGIQRQQQQQITMFYDGRICVCNVTDDQAKAIICMAKTAKEEEQQKLKELSPCPSLPPSRSAVTQLINPELSMKRSLQRFLQKRKARIDNATPYSINRHRVPSLTSSYSHALS